ncbi:MAG: 50S ribosomal protein L11 methyltransferase [Lentisphaerae bacterium]|nr:50S ribosomal protein L11 methyltransferase [Lentisphaerota bacterium]
MECIHVVVIESAAADVPMIEEALAAADFVVSSYSSRETGRASTYVMADDDNDANDKLKRVSDALIPWQDAFTGPSAVKTACMQQEDWSESWKKHFHSFRASTRLVVKPSWEDVEPQAGDIILSLDPGMCFGTGYHGTTKACLQFLDDLEAQQGPRSFLDAGCGSGILSLGARLLGYEPVYAFDNDPQAVSTAYDNLALAGVHDVAIHCAELGAYQPPQPCQVVAANILAVVLLKYAEDVCKLVDRKHGDGYLILSGILTEQYPEVLQRYQALGARELKRTTIDEWTSGCFALPQQK